MSDEKTPGRVRARDTSRVNRPRTGYPFLDTGLDQPGSVLAFAHRGGAYHPELEGLENTLAAFRHAVDLGYGYLETDVHTTRDGTLLAFHDSMLDRVTGAKGAIATLHYGEVAEALIGGREAIPTMASLMEKFPETRFNIDIKSEAAIEPLARLVDRMQAHDRVCVASFSAARLRRFRASVHGRVVTSAAPLDVAQFRLLPAARLAEVLTRGRVGALQVPARHGRLRIVTPALVERAHRMHKHVHVWTVDDPAEMHQLLDLGVDGLMTDRTDLLREVLVERGQWMRTGG